MKIKQTQNFLKNKQLVDNLIDEANIKNTDLVLDIGAGKGIITEALSNKAKKVYAYELDKKLYKYLETIFTNTPNVKLFNHDFLQSTLPNQQYKVFANIPFAISTQIIDKLLESNNPPKYAYLIVQKEFANKLIGKPNESLKGIIYKAFFDFAVIYNFSRQDYKPSPSVDTVLLSITHKENPSIENAELYKDFVSYLYTSWKPNVKEALSFLFTKVQYKRISKENNIDLNGKITSLGIVKILAIYEIFLHLLRDKHHIVKGTYHDLAEQQAKLDKIHRSRTDRNWQNK